MIRLGLVICMMAFALEAYAYNDADYCSGDAQAVAQANGGDSSTVTLTFSSVDGFGVNMSGDSVYTFQRGNQICTISYNVFGTYFGTKCSLEGLNCPNPKLRSRHR